MLLVNEMRECVVFENNNQKLFGILHLPDSHKKAPAVVIFHGFASHKVGRNRSFVKIAQDLCAKGIAVLRFDFRGAGDSEGSLSEMTIQSLISDGSAAYNFLANHPKIDENRIGILGSSLGGAIAVLVGRALSLKALVLWAPVARGEIWFNDWLAKQNLSKEQGQETLKSYNGIDLHPDFRRQFFALAADSETSYLSHVPLLHIHGEQDNVISLSHRDSYKNCRNSTSTDSKFILIPDTDHTLGTSIHFPKIAEETCHWFEKHLFL